MRARPAAIVTAVARRIAPIWVAAVIIGSFLPGDAKKTIGTRPYVLHQPVAPQHRLAHVATFGITALLLLLADRPNNRARAAGGAFLLGCAIEVVQYAIGFAPALEWWDLRDDAIGVMGVWVVFVSVEALSLRSRRA